MNNLGDHLGTRQAELGLDRADHLSDIQALLDQWYPGQAHAASLNHGVLRIATTNASVASDLRLRQVELIKANPNVEIKRLAIGGSAP